MSAMVIHVILACLLDVGSSPDSDRTHVKIVAVALIACVAIVSAGKAARQDLSDTNARVEARAQMIAADKSVLWTSVGHIIR
jgi:predicted outer membrane protein